jgi:hypothetical protein
MIEIPREKFYYVAGPFAAAVSLFVCAAKRFAGEAPRPEYAASLVTNLISAGVSARAALEIKKIAENVRITRAKSDLGFMREIEDVGRQDRVLLLEELTSDQLAAYDLSSSMTLGNMVSSARWEIPEEKRDYLLNCLKSALGQAKVLELDTQNISDVLRSVEEEFKGGNIESLARYFQTLSDWTLKRLLGV